MRQGVRKGATLGFVTRLSSEEEKREDFDTARVVTQVQAGDVGAYARLYERYFDRVYGYLLVVLADQREAEDAAQHVFVKALEAMPRYEQRSQPFRAWLFRIARNHAIDQLRRLERVRPTDPSEIREWQEEASFEDEELSALLRWISDDDLMLFVDRLPAVQRQALMLRYTADLSAAQIAKILNRSAADVRMLQSRALRFLRARLGALASRVETPDRPPKMRRLPKEAPVLRSRRWSLFR